MKTLPERAIPVQQVFIHLLNGETRHVQRTAVPKQTTIVGCDVDSEEEQEIFEQLIDRNAKNM